MNLWFYYPCLPGNGKQTIPNLKTNSMKKIFKKCIAICLVQFLLHLSNTAEAQNILSPNNPDTILAYPTVSGFNVNSAIYDQGNTKLFGSTYTDGAGTSYFTIRDNSQYVASMPMGLYSGTMWDFFGPADMVIGAPYSLATQYFVGVVYGVTSNQVPYPGAVYLDVYKIEYQLGVPTITGQNTQIPIATNIGMHINIPHIDLVNKQDQNTPSIFYSDKFVITWATSSGMNTTIEACSGSLIDAYNFGATNIIYESAPINNVGTITAGWESDIAGIERGIGVNNQDIAHIVFTDNAGLPYITEWEIDVMGGSVNYNNTPLDSDPAFTPRIDGLDPYTQATNGDPYCAVWTYDAGSGLRQIKSYALTNGLLPNTANAYNGTISATNAWYPTVTCSPDLSYTVEFYSQGTADVYLQTVDWYNVYNNNCSCTTGGNPTEDYFQVNATTGSGSFQTSNSNGWAYNSGTGNLEPSITLVAWADYTNSLSPTISYKRFSTLTTNPFKEPNSVTGITNDTSISIAPNPAYDKLDIEGIANGTDYAITDVTGRNVQSGKIASAHIHINTLASGMYILNTGNQKVKFIKE
jgi:hypothetical protein